MEPAARDARAGKRHVQARLAERTLKRGSAQPLLERFDTTFDFALYLVDELADRRALLGRDLAHPAHHVGQFAAAPEHAHAHRLDLLGAGAVAQLCNRRGAKSLQLFSHPVLKNSVCASSSPRVSAPNIRTIKQKTMWTRATWSLCRWGLLALSGGGFGGGLERLLGRLGQFG